MRFEYEVSWWNAENEETRSRYYVDEKVARLYAERIVREGGDQATVIKWMLQPNLPGAKPDIVHKCISMSHFRSDFKWYGAWIHGPESYSEFLEEFEI
jgi:hypothetical protein